MMPSGSRGWRVWCCEAELGLVKMMVGGCCIAAAVVSSAIVVVVSSSDNIRDNSSGREWKILASSESGAAATHARVRGRPRRSAEIIRVEGRCMNAFSNGRE